MTDDHWLERLATLKLAEHDARVRSRQAEKTARQRRHGAIILKRQHDAEVRARLREQRKQLCGARTRAILVAEKGLAAAGAARTTAA